MSKTLLEKLLLRPGLRVRLVNVPKSVMPLFEPLPEGVHANESGARPADWLIVFVKDRAALDAFATVAVSEVAYDGVLWIAHHGQGGGRAGGPSYDETCRAMEPFGFDAVASVAVNESWNAIRFRPRERIGR